MIERLTRLDDLAQARGFRCAFVGERLLLALSGLRWRAPLWRVVFPLGRWLAAYRDWLAELIAMPAAVVRELALNAQVPAVGAQPRFAHGHPWETAGAGDSVMHGKLARLVAGIGMPAIYIASGTMFGGISLFFGYYIFFVWGVAGSGGWKVAWVIPLGILYGVYAIGMGLVMLARLRLDLERAAAECASLSFNLSRRRRRRSRRASGVVIHLPPSSPLAYKCGGTYIRETERGEVGYRLVPVGFDLVLLLLHPAYPDRTLGDAQTAL